MSEHATPAAPAHDHGHDAGHAEPHGHPNYLAIFYALCALTLASVIADVFGGPTLGKYIIAGVVLVIASFKAMFVMLYFMHLKFEGKWKYVLLAPTMILALAIIAALTPDIGSHYYDTQVPQNDVVPAAAHHEGETGAAHGGETPHEG